MSSLVKNTFTGNGTTSVYSFTFPYINPSDVKVSINNSPTSAFSFNNASSLRFNSPPGNGKEIVIYRITPVEQSIHTFYSGSSIRAQDLNDDFDQILYAYQESDSTASEANEIANEAFQKAEQAAQDAQQAADDAAQSAQDAASAAEDAASAGQDAADALAAANAAQIAADQAKADAAEAKADASTAVASAASAQANAALALQSAAEANASAIDAKEAAQDAAAAAEAALSLITDFIGNGAPYSTLYQTTGGAVGSKVIDLGDLSSLATCANSHFPGEDIAGSETYNMGLGCSSIDYGSF